MKKLLAISILILTLSCSTEEPNVCECTQSFYEVEQYVTTNQFGLPSLAFRINFLYDQPIVCSDEVQEVYVTDDRYYNIECD